MENKITSLSIAIPAFNDSKTIRDLIQDAVGVARSVTRDYEILLIDDGSSDNTAELISALARENKCIRLLIHPVNKGYGITIKDLYLNSTKDYIFTCPGDGQIPPGEIVKMITGIEKFDIVVGFRKDRKDGFKRKVQTAVYNFLLGVIYGLRISDVNSVKLLRKRVIENITLNSASPFVDAELCIKAKISGFQLGEIAIEHLPRKFRGNSGGKPGIIISTVLDIFRQRKEIIRHGNNFRD